MNALQKPASLIGRILIALLFVPAGLHKFTAFAGTVGYIASQGVPLPEVAAVIAIVVEALGGIALIVGFQTRWVALGMAVFTFVISFIFHHFWDVPAEQVMMQQLNFFKNMAIVGGLLGFVAAGAGAWSIDGIRKA